MSGFAWQCGCCGARGPASSDEDAIERAQAHMLEHPRWAHLVALWLFKLSRLIEAWARWFYAVRT